MMNYGWITVGWVTWIFVSPAYWFKTELSTLIAPVSKIGDSSSPPLFFIIWASSYVAKLPSASRFLLMSREFYFSNMGLFGLKILRLSFFCNVVSRPGPAIEFLRVTKLGPAAYYWTKSMTVFLRCWTLSGELVLKLSIFFKAMPRPYLDEV